MELTIIIIVSLACAWILLALRADKGRAKPNIEPVGFSRLKITCKISIYHRPIGRVLGGFSDRLQVKNCLNWSHEAACRRGCLYSAIKVFSAISMAVI